MLRLTITVCKEIRDPKSPEISLEASLKMTLYKQIACLQLKTNIEKQTTNKQKDAELQVLWSDTLHVHKKNSSLLFQKSWIVGEPIKTKTTFNPFLPDWKTGFSQIFVRFFYAIFKFLRPEHDCHAKFASCST